MVITAQKDTTEIATASESIALFSSADVRGKDTRASQDRGLTKWAFDGLPRRDLVEFLENQCREAMGAGVVNQMFSTDHYKEKDFISALSSIDDYIVAAIKRGGSDDAADAKSRVFSNADLILKYLTIRFFDTNTSMLIKCLELLEHLFTMMDGEGWILTDYEASCFFPYFIQKVGDNKETMRAKIRGIMRQSCRVFPASKLFVFILDGLKSKNARTRAECLEELGDLIKRNGMAVCGASNGAKAMPLIAAQISDGDAKVRNAALVAIGQAYQLVGDAVYKLVGRLSDKERSMLEEKLRRMPPPPSAAPPPEPAEPKAPRLPPGMVRSTPPVMTPEEPPVPVAREDFRRDFSLDLDKLKATHRVSVSQKSDYMAYQSEALASPNPTGDGNHTSGTSLLLDFVVTQITSGEVDQSIDALKQLERYLVSGGNSPGFMPDPVLLEHLDDAVSAITLQIRIAFTSASPATPGPFARLCKHLIGSLVQIFSSGAFAKAVGPEALARCIRELLTRLLDPRFANNAEGSDGQLSRALNVLMVKFTELIMKCIWKMTKVIPQLIEQGSLNVSELLFTVHTFLKNTPPVEWKRRAAEKITPQADMPLRTVKTILHELVAELGDQVMDNIGMIDDPGRSATVTYLKQMIESGRRKNGQPAANSASPPAVQTDGGARMSERSSPPAAATSGYEPVVRQQPKSLAQRSPRTAGLTEEEADMQLTVVFSRIGQKDETKQGIADLHDFRKRHPEHEDLVQKHLLRTGSYFQGYI
ncbi:Microtubule-associated protein, microtubule dynamics during spindle orientation, partial [Cladochytrium tenue]